MEENHVSRQKRKEDGKKNKRQRIAEAGGKRPRKEGGGVDSNNAVASKREQQPHKQRRHNFGRVMEQVPCRNKPRFSTVSMAVPGSVVANCQTREQKTQIAGQIARAATIYHVDEIVVYDDKLSPKRNGDSSHSSGLSEPNAFLARLLQFCETPQYLRRYFFPVHPDLQFVGMLAPIDAPHHVRVDDKCRYREGLVMEKKAGKKNGESSSTGCLVNCGVRNRPVLIDQRLKPGIRCTVRIDSYNPGQLRGTLVSPRLQTETDGTYWGYTVRMASSLQAIWDECPFPGGYDLKIGTSERGKAVVDDPNFKLCKSSYKHSLIVLGGVAGIEECVDADESLKLSGALTHSLFDTWVNVCPYQGSRTIRTEEAVLITLAKLSPHLLQAGMSKRDTDERDPEQQQVEPTTFEDKIDISDESSEDEDEAE